MTEFDLSFICLAGERISIMLDIQLPQLRILNLKEEENWEVGIEIYFCENISAFEFAWFKQEQLNAEGMKSLELMQLPLLEVLIFFNNLIDNEAI